MRCPLARRFADALMDSPEVLSQRCESLAPVNCRAACFPRSQRHLFDMAQLNHGQISMIAGLAGLLVEQADPPENLLELLLNRL